ncbi:uncharacterized protein LOC125944333 [Dermacentor silvarum]|uniref:uncharacterized protein LOC125944333 n=1 Tax=Dermacentor silvarum TaxID=543639 RepID=UPI002101A211|nr:uncharacterized protein LOC125944333 [Dermacentor silvarum]
MEIRLNVGGVCSMEVGMPVGRCPSDDHGHTEAAVIIDRCWSIPATIAAAAFLVCMPSACFGLFFVLFMNQFGATREEAAWPENVFALASHLSEGFPLDGFASH